MLWPFFSNHFSDFSSSCWMHVLIYVYVTGGTYLSLAQDLRPLICSFTCSSLDLCPVGALTSKPYSFTARPWELR